MKYLLIIEGFDPSALPTTPTNAQLLQMVHEAQFASDVGAEIESPTTPDVVQYPILKRFRWAKTAAGVRIGEFYYHDGSSWVIEKPAVGSITGNMLVDGTVGIEKLNAAGDPFQIIRVNATATGFEFIDIVDAIPDSSLSTDKLSAGSGADLALLSGLGGSWAPVSLQYFFGRIYSIVSGVSDFSGLTDKILFKRASDNAVLSLSVLRFFTSGFDQAAVIAATENSDFGMVLDSSDGLFKKVLLSNWLPNTGVAAGTYTGITQATINAKGQITAISATGTAGAALVAKDTGVAGYAAQAILATTETVIRLTSISPVSWATMAANVITLAAGTYTLDAVVPIYEATGNEEFIVMLYNNTAASILATVSASNEGDVDLTTANLKHVFTLSASSNITMRIYSSAACALGDPVNLGTYAETYTQVLINKIL